MNHIGIDLGGTKIEGILLDEHFQVLNRKRVLTPKNYTEILSAIKKLIGEMQVDDYSIGICTPGSVSGKFELIQNSNTQCLIGMPIKKDLEQVLQSEILLENDANCFAMAEASMGAAQGYGTVFGVIMGTGVGGGIVIDGKLHLGRNSISGEWGHHTLHRNGNACYCGKNGCTETYISGPSLERRWTELSGQRKSLCEILENFDDMSGKVWRDEFLENFGYSLANVIDILDPDVIVMGGGLSNIDFLYTEGAKSVYEKVFSSIDTPILKNKLGDSAGVFGAALLK